jgi:hypothetical protein
MERIPVSSSNIKSIGHDPHTNTLEVEFASGKLFQYEDVNVDEHAALLGAKSVGSHFANIIKPVKQVKVVDNGDH